MSTHAHDRHAVRRNRRNSLLAFGLAGLVAGMVGLSYAAVPLYRIFCQVTGYAGTARIAEKAPDTVTGTQVTVRFDANIARDLKWTFRPVQGAIDLKAGETKLALYRATNNDDRAVTGSATFNVTPDWAGQYFNKIECFCFTEQTLQPGETVDMPVAFFIDPKIAEDRAAARAITITLSYTFYPVAGAGKPLATVAPAKGAREGSGG